MWELPSTPLGEGVSEKKRAGLLSAEVQRIVGTAAESFQYVGDVSNEHRRMSETPVSPSHRSPAPSRDSLRRKGHKGGGKRRLVHVVPVISDGFNAHLLLFHPYSLKLELKCTAFINTDFTKNGKKSFTVYLRI